MYVHIYLVKTLYVLHMDVIRTHIHVCIDDMYVHIYCYIAFIVVVIMGMRWGCVCCLATSKAGDREGEVLSLSLSLSLSHKVYTHAHHTLTAFGVFCIIIKCCGSVPAASSRSSFKCCYLPLRFLRL